MNDAGAVIIAGGPIVAVMIHVPDVPAALDWYGRALAGATRRRLPPPHDRMEVLDVGGVMVEVVPADDKVAASAAGSVVYWRVADFEAALRHLLSLGATLYRGPGEIEDRMRMCQVRDPWGNCIGLRGPAGRAGDV
jgi:predicted enzyme related to lactoylglutathione lyase